MFHFSMVAFFKKKMTSSFLEAINCQ
jgi:hypothetical protein